MITKARSQRKWFGYIWLEKKFAWQSAFSKCFIGNNFRQNQIEIKLIDQI